MNSPIIFEDIFDVKDIDKEGKKFDRVSRLNCSSETYEMDLDIDINIEVYPVEVGQKFTFALATTLNTDGSPDEGVFDAAIDQRSTLLDRWEYVMYGKVFKILEEAGKLAAYVSFGGLLMRLRGDPQNLQGIELDARLYCLIRKV